MPKKSKPYFTLAVKTPDQLWTPEFGDYDRSVVDQEQHDTKEGWPKGTKFKIIRTGDAQSDVSAGIDALNNNVETA